MPRRRRPKAFSTGRPIVETTLRAIPPHTMRTRFKILRLLPGLRNPFSRGGRCPSQRYT